jgi:hypothetical protein
MLTCTDVDNEETSRSVTAGISRRASTDTIATARGVAGTIIQLLPQPTGY